MRRLDLFGNFNKRGGGKVYQTKEEGEQFFCQSQFLILHAFNIYIQVKKGPISQTGPNQIHFNTKSVCVSFRQRG